MSTRPTPNETVEQLSRTVDIPVVVTVVSEYTDIQARLDAGASILNVSGAAKTPEIVRAIRRDFPDVPILATGGSREESILRTIDAGANAITFTPPTPAELFKAMMVKYRLECDGDTGDFARGGGKIGRGAGIKKGSFEKSGLFYNEMEDRPRPFREIMGI